ncbi:MAG TPA: multicopper oxidase domain-containing protein [Rhizomicrobium sp.]|jgi:FtsP/CotA-like multicopper oxidase with cupredoxin domain
MADRKISTLRAFAGVFFLLLAIGFLPSCGQAVAAPLACQRPAAGTEIAPPPDLYSANGVLKLALNYASSVDRAGRTLFCFVTPTGQQSPTLHVKPGDTIVIAFTNTLPAPPPSAPTEVMSHAANRCGASLMTVASANIHFHGTNTAPVCHSDEVIHTLVNSGQSFTYRLKIPADEPPGLYWYHPHVHGLSEAALLGGASGVLEVEGIADLQPAVAGLAARYLVLRDQLVANPPSQSAGAPPLPGWDVSLNYVPVSYPTYRPAVIRMTSGSKEFWRVVNASADTMLDLQLLYDGKAQPLRIVALDAIALGSQDGTRKGTIQTQTHVLMAPAARAEFIVTAPTRAVQNAMLVTRAVKTGPAGDIDPARPLARIKAGFGFGVQPQIVSRGEAAGRQRFEGLAEATPTATRHLNFSEVVIPGTDRRGHRREEPGITHFFITVDGQRPTLFNPDNPPAITTTQGSVEDWTIENRSGEIHAFHIHQIHFLLLAVNGVAVPKSRKQFYDTYPVDFWRGKGPYPSIKVRMDFRGPVVGDFVYHCHILEHEDAGMMATIRVLPRGQTADESLIHSAQRPRTLAQIADPHWKFPAVCKEGLAR